jgi:hypothetical protein
LYEKLVKKDMDNKSQQLLVHESIFLNPKEISILDNYKEIFLEM